MSEVEYELLRGSNSPTKPTAPPPELFQNGGSQYSPTYPSLTQGSLVDSQEPQQIDVVYQTLGSARKGSLVTPSSPIRTPSGEQLLGKESLYPEIDIYLSGRRRKKSLSPRSYRNEVISSVLCCFGNLAHGLAYGLASPAVPALIKCGALKTYQASLFESLLTVGALVGGIFVGFLVDHFGRKGTLLLSVAPFLSGWMCLAISEWYVVLYAGRVLTGIGYGLVAVVCPLYIVETVSKEVRGGLTMFVSLASTSGILLQFCMGLKLETRWLAVVSMTPVFIMLIGMSFMPESPRWLMSRGRYDKALKALIWFRRCDTTDVLDEYREMAESTNVADGRMCTSCDCSWPEMSAALKPILICSMLFVFQQLSGTTPIIFNAQEIFSAVGFTNAKLKTGQVPAIILAAVKMATTVIGIFLVDRVGRRPLFISCGLVMGASCIGVGLYFRYIYYLVESFTWIPLLALVFYEAAYSIAWGGIPWLLLSEVPPARYRGVAAATGSIATRLSSFIVTQVFVDLVIEIKFSGTFWLYGGVCVAGSLFAWKFMPETKQRSLENIEHDLTLSVHILTESTA